MECRRYRIEPDCKAALREDGSDKCDGIAMDSLITAAARALAAGDALAALKRVALLQRTGEMYDKPKSPKALRLALNAQAARTRVRFGASRTGYPHATRFEYRAS
jgi:hypothetical protein